MFDIGLELRDILKQIDGVSVCFAYPDNFNKLPAIAYYTLTDKGSMSYDNTVIRMIRLFRLIFTPIIRKRVLNCRRGYINC